MQAARWPTRGPFGHLATPLTSVSSECDEGAGSDSSASEAGNPALVSETSSSMFSPLPPTEVFPLRPLRCTHDHLQPHLSQFAQSRHALTQMAKENALISKLTRKRKKTMQRFQLPPCQWARGRHALIQMANENALNSKLRRTRKETMQRFQLPLFQWVRGRRVSMLTMIRFVVDSMQAPRNVNTLVAILDGCMND